MSRRNDEDWLAATRSGARDRRAPLRIAANQS